MDSWDEKKWFFSFPPDEIFQRIHFLNVLIKPYHNLMIFFCANTFLISNSTNINKIRVGIFTRQGHINQLSIKQELVSKCVTDNDQSHKKVSYGVGMAKKRNIFLSIFFY